MSNILKTILTAFVALTLIGCGGSESGGGGGGSARLQAPVLTSSNAIESTSQTSSIGSVNSFRRIEGTNQFILRTSAGEYRLVNDFRHQPNSIGLVNGDGTLAFVFVSNVQSYEHALTAAILRGNSLNDDRPNITEVIFLQERVNVTPVNALPAQASVQYVGELFFGSAEDAETNVSSFGSVFPNTDRFSLEVDFLNSAGTISGRVEHFDAFGTPTGSGTLTGRRETGNNANQFDLTYTGNANTYVSTATLNGAFYGEGAAELSAVGRGTRTGDATSPVVVGIVGTNTTQPPPPLPQLPQRGK